MSPPFLFVDYFLVAFPALLVLHKPRSLAFYLGRLLVWHLVRDLEGATPTYILAMWCVTEAIRQVGLGVVRMEELPDHNVHQFIATYFFPLVAPVEVYALYLAGYLWTSAGVGATTTLLWTRTILKRHVEPTLLPDERKDL